MEEKIEFIKEPTDREYLKLIKIKEPNPKAFKVKCLGWCDKDFLSASKFLRFCEKCKSKKNKISEDNSISEHGSCGISFSVED